MVVQLLDGTLTIVSEYEELFTRLDSEKEITDYEKEKISITKKYHDLLFEEYGLTDDDFIISKQAPSTIDNINNKTLVKKLPGLRIENNIEYYPIVTYVLIFIGVIFILLIIRKSKKNHRRRRR